MAFAVTGSVSICGGAACLHLEPAVVPSTRPTTTRARPSGEEQAEKVHRGELLVHASRRPFTRDALHSALNTVQKRLGLTQGMQGQWSDEADSSLAKLLAAPKRGSRCQVKDSKALLALPAPPKALLALLALPAPPRNGKKLRVKAGTQVIDRCWRFLKDRLTLYQNAKVGSLILSKKLRSAQYQYWYKNSDLWVATGALCKWHFSRSYTA